MKTKNYFSKTFITIVSLLIVLGVFCQNIYPQLGIDDDPFWKSLDKFTDRMFTIVLLAIVGIAIKDAMIQVIASLAAFYFAVQLYFEILFFYHQIITTSHYSYLLAFVSIMECLVLMIIFNVKRGEREIH